MIELPPKFILHKALQSRARSRCQKMVLRINDEYLYWTEMKHKTMPEDISPEEMWSQVKLQRFIQSIKVWEKYEVVLVITNEMQRMCHEYDMNFGSSWGADSIIPREDNQQYLVSSLMEEAISSSQMEGANTTRKVAKDMLRKQLTPRDKSQQMILNNYNTIRFIVENKEKSLDVDMLKEVHRLMTTSTLENEEYAGKFRITNDVVVENGITHEVVHTPPPAEEIPEFINDLCKFFNEKSSVPFIHPIIRGIIIHYMLAFVHPFIDGNGRTARALFYWFMLKQGYWLSEYLSISRIIATSKKSYERAYLYAEADGNDASYFVQYHLRVLGLAFKQLKNYIERKQKEKLKANTFIHIGNINERQASIIQLIHTDGNTVLTIKDLQNRFFVSPTTAKTDIIGLIELELVEEISFNKVKKGYIKGKQFDAIISRHTI